MLRAPLTLCPVLLPHHESALVVLPKGPTAYTWIFTRINYHPSPWLTFDTTYQIAPDDTREFLVEMPLMSKPELARFLKSIYHHFGRDTRLIDQAIDAPNIVSYALNTAQIVAYRYRYLPTERFNELARASHPVWSNLYRMRYYNRGSDNNYRHRVAFQFGQALVANWQGQQALQPPGTEAIREQLNRVGSVTLTRNHYQTKAKLNFSALGQHAFDDILDALDERTRRWLGSINNLQQLCQDGFERFEALMRDSTVGLAMTYYLHNLKGEQSPVNQDGSLSLELSLILFLATGRLGDYEPPAITKTVMVRHAKSAEYVGVFPAHMVGTLYNLSNSLHRVNMAVKRQEKLLEKPSNVVFKEDPLSSVKIRLLMPKVVAEKDKNQYILKSSDGSYEKTKVLGDDLIEGDDYLDLLYEDVDPSLSYTLKCTGNKKNKTYFENISYRSLKGLSS